MELTTHKEADSFDFGHLTIRDLTPSRLQAVTLAEVEVPIGAENPPFAATGNDKVYVCIEGDVEFVIEAEPVRLAAGDSLLVDAGEHYSYHNGGYQPARLLLVQLPHPD